MGFRKLGEMRERFRRGGSVSDLVLAFLLDDDWAAQGAEQPEAGGDAGAVWVRRERRDILLAFFG